MTRLLVSVRDAVEAATAREAGAGLIDFKDPAAGALGMLDIDVLKRGLAAVAGACPTSATAGDLPADPDSVVSAVERLAGTDVDYIKVGLWPGPLRNEVVRRLGREFSRGSQLVGVLLADAEPDPDLIPLLAEARFAGAMLDVAKKGRSLLDLIARDDLAIFRDRCRANGLMSGLAGSLRIAHIPLLAALDPDVIGVRGGLCRGFDRTAPLDRDLTSEAVRTLRAMAV